MSFVTVLSRSLCAGVLALASITGVRAEVLAVGGTGAAGPIVQRLFEAFARQEPDATLKLVTPPLGSSGGIKAAMAGKLDLGFSGRPLRTDEATQVAAVFVLADTAFVLAARDGADGGGMTLAAVADAYAGKLAKWPSGKPVRLILRAANDSDTDQLRAMSPAMNVAVPLAAQRPGMAVAGDDLEALDMLARTPGALGPTTLGLLRASGAALAPLAIDGVTPSPTTLKNGAYPWRKPIYVVVPKNAKGLAERFAKWLRSGEADMVLARYDYLRAR